MVTTSSAPLILSAGKSVIGSLFHSTAAAYPQRIAIRDEQIALTYADIETRSNSLANHLLSVGVGQGDRVAVLSKNRIEYFEVLLAAAKIGAIVAALNWRLIDHELAHCINLASPKVIFASAEFTALLDRCEADPSARLMFGEAYETTLAASPAIYPNLDVDPETGLVILYTSGTTGMPKGALISHRAMIARGLLYHLVMQVPDEDNFIAWTPFYHMVATDHGLATLVRGGTVWCVDGYQPARLIWLLENLEISWFVLVPGMVGMFNDELRKHNVKPKSVKLIGAMADLVPREDIAAATLLFNAPFLNTFGATETGLPPGTGGRIAIGVVPDRLSKTQTPYCDLRLEDADGSEVPVGSPGEASLAGPTLFSGYWNNEKTNVDDFRNGRFHMGDVLRRNADGTLDYVDRVKYMIKSGGENIYPAEIESVIAIDERIATAIVVRKKDAKWGEVPVVFVVRRDESLAEEDVLNLCKNCLASYKKPKAVYFIADEDIPRSTTGKIQRHLLELKV